MPDPISLTLQWPSMLWLLVALPVLAAFQLWQSRRGRQATLRFAGLGGIAASPGKGVRWRRSVPPVLMLLGIAALILAVARPQAALMLPARLESIILAMDVSGSMKATASRGASAPCSCRCSVRLRPFTRSSTTKGWAPSRPTSCTATIPG